MMSKFDPLGTYLSKQTASVLVLSFSEIEKIIGEKLCPSAYRYTAYWHPCKTHSLPNLIESYGYHVEKADIVNQKITLRRK
jgi:hypothetical protein